MLLSKKDIILTDFEQFGLHPAIIKSVKSLGFNKPTPIQEQGIPLVLEGFDIMGLAQTGTGKTAAFGLPLVEHLLKEKERPENKTARALILAPTRELANQIASNMRDYVRHTHLKVNVVVGGSSIQVQRQKLGRGSDILIATPGRLLDLVERNAIYLDMVKYLVLDEADQMLDLGFIHILREISELLGTPRQTLLFSATMPKSIAALSKAFLKDPKRIEVAPAGKAADKIAQSVHFIGNRSKADLLKQCLNDAEGHLSLVFSRTKHGAEKLKKHLIDRGFKADSIHGNKSQGQRDRAIRGFKSGETRVLVATDVAARGIDISGVSHVYNYDLPEMAENYVHRIGRTARAGASGKAVAFCSPAEISLLRAVEKLMGITIEIASGEISEEEERKNSKNNPRSRTRRNKPKRNSKVKNRLRDNKSKAFKGQTKHSKQNELDENKAKQNYKGKSRKNPKRFNNDNKENIADNLANKTKSPKAKWAGKPKNSNKSNNFTKSQRANKSKWAKNKNKKPVAA